MAGIIYRDMEMIKGFAKQRKLSEKMHPGFTPKHNFSITTTPELLGLIDKKLVRIKK